MNSQTHQTPKKIPRISEIYSDPTFTHHNKAYFANKHSRQLQKMKTCFVFKDQDKLEQFQLDIKALVPNFFTKTLPMKRSQKVVMPDHQKNLIYNSYVCMDIPVHTDKEIFNSLLLYSSNEVRIGRILQCMDSMAGIVGYEHCFRDLKQKNPFVLVTACADSINLFEPITVEENIRIEGYVNHVGRTSMEIEINLWQSGLLKSNALFTMVSRDASNMKNSYPCPQVDFTGLCEDELQKARSREESARINVQRRKKQLKQSLKNVPPTTEGIKILHDMFLNITQISKNCIDIEQTVVTNTRLMHVQQRNVHHKIFGGYLMKQMVETAWITACRYAGNENMRVEDITNIYFKEAVEIGCHLKVKGMVSFTHGNILVLTIEALTYNFQQKPTEKMCCYLHMFVTCEDEQKKVYPRSYEDGVHFLTAKKAYEQVFPSP